jgi:hypothetical protein
MKPAPACQFCGEVVQFGTPVIRVQYGTMDTTVKHLRVVGRRKEGDDYFHQRCAGGVAIRGSSE